MIHSEAEFRISNVLVSSYWSACNSPGVKKEKSGVETFKMFFQSQVHNILFILWSTLITVCVCLCSHIHKCICEVYGYQQ